MTQFFDFAGRSLDLASPHVMGVLNVTPDSFSDGGELLVGNSQNVSLSKALARAESMLAAGAAFIDVGGESTRPGANPVSAQEEMDRVLPVVEVIHHNLDIIISVDTSRPELIRECANYGVGLINDVRALNVEGALLAAVESNIPVCLMHMQGQPDTMQNAPVYSGLLEEVSNFLAKRVACCEAIGLSRDKILLDPGFGFGKTLGHNLELLHRLGDLQSLELPLLIGLSRKRMLGALTGKEEKDRMAGGLAAAVIAVMNGANVIRTHDVSETVDAMKICRAVFDA